MTENVLFRRDLHGYLASASKQARNDFVEKCRLCPPITFKTMFWTFQPKPNIEPKGVLPFITWDWQDKRIIELNEYMLSSGKVQIKKSREVGATWLVLGCGLNLWLFTPNVMGLVTSRKEEYVDRKGNPDCLYWKLDFMLDKLPEWSIPSFVRTERHLENRWNGSVIDGEATVENVGRGGRRNWSFCDEFPAVKHTDAEAMERALTDTASCMIYLGTSEYQSHPHSKMGKQKGVIKMAFGWWLHPYKRRGIYYSPDLNVIVIEDIDYYRNIAPKVFNKYKNGQEITYSELEKELFVEYPEIEITFVADGGQPNKPKWRSPWYDKTCEQRTEKDIATNLDMNEIGAGDSVFTQSTINQMLDEYVRKPDYQGEIIYDLYEDRITNIKYVQGGKGRLKWWGNLGGARPLQNHNYVLGCDISLGQGQSNSVCSVFDVDERQKVGCWVDAYTLPEQFAEQIYALGKWIGGLSGEPFLNFEANGIGQVFLKRIKELGYNFICKSTVEKKGYHQKSQVLGWYNSSNNLLQLFSAYDAAMTACFRKKMNNKMFVNPDMEALRECEDYIFNGSKIILSACIEETGGAKAAHGDRVVADALCCLASQDQGRAVKLFEENIAGTAAWAIKRERDRKYKLRNKTKLWLDF